MLYQLTISKLTTEVSYLCFLFNDFCKSVNTLG
jgi:hypothetical protein